MIPIHIDPKFVRIALVGRGELTVKRLRWLMAGGAAPDVWSDAPEPALIEAAGAHFAPRMPTAAELAGYHLVWVADLSPAESRAFADQARGLRVLVNVEDLVPACDFHTPAVVRRGRLTLTAGTGGASPAVARAARERLEAAFDSDWGEALAEIEKSRTELRVRNAGIETLIADARKRLGERGLA